MPRVVLDLRKWDDYGIGTYLKALTTGLRTLDPPDLDFTGLHPFPNRVSPLPARPFEAGDYSLKGLLCLGRTARKAGADLLHVPHFTLPWMAPPAVLTVHDLIHLRFPAEFGRFRTALLRLFLRRALRRAVRIVAVSKATLDELLEFDPHLRPRVRHVPNATLPEFYADHDHPPGDHYLFVGNAKPHKNLPVLLEAWVRFHAGHPDRRLVLVTPGEFGGPGVEVRRRVSGQELRALVASARALVAPSRWEGFDLPVLEAVLSMTPVVASDIPAHVELLGGDHPLLFPAGHAGALRLRLEEAERHGISRARLAALRARHRPYGPTAMAESTAAVYREALESSAGRRRR